MQTVDYKAIARRFRPRTFGEVTGQEAIVSTIKNALKYQKVSHAYLFSGIRGTGKTTLARLFAKAINCEHLSPDCEPCNECSSCIEISEGRSLDILEIDGASNRGIDDIRSLNETLSYATAKGRYKIFIIDEVHMLTKEAFNALLKSLEEPPQNVKFFLATTEPQKVLPTIVSRCQRFDLHRIPSGQMIQKLRLIGKELNVLMEDEALSLIAKLSEGSLRDAESLLDQMICLGKQPITASLIAEALGFVTKEDFFALDTAYHAGDLGFGFTLAGKLFTTGRDMTFFLENLLEHYRNIALLLLEKISLDYITALEVEKEGYQKACKIYSLEEVMYILDYLSGLIHQTTRPMFKKIHIEMVVLHIIESKKRVLLDDLIEHIAQGTPIKIAKHEPKEIEKPEEKNPPIEVKEENLQKRSTNQDSTRIENLLRFTQVELGATLNKNI